MKSKEYTYVSHMTWEIDGRQISFDTSLYSVGLYIVLNSNGRMLEQHAVDPKDMPKLQAEHIAALKADPQVKDLVLGPEITVFENEDGFWETKQPTPRAVYELEAVPFEDGRDVKFNYKVYEADEMLEGIDDLFYARVTSEEELKNAVRSGEDFCGLKVKSYRKVLGDKL